MTADRTLLDGGRACVVCGGPIPRSRPGGPKTCGATCSAILRRETRRLVKKRGRDRNREDWREKRRAEKARKRARLKAAGIAPKSRAKTRPCVICGTAFAGRRGAKTCSETCSAALVRRRVQKPRSAP